jgi:hypothetical protein
MTVNHGVPGSSPGEGAKVLILANFNQYERQSRTERCGFFVLLSLGLNKRENFIEKEQQCRLLQLF